MKITIHIIGNGKNFTITDFLLENILLYIYIFICLQSPTVKNCAY